jgi:hypothetical protein
VVLAAAAAAVEGAIPAQDMVLAAAAAWVCWERALMGPAQHRPKPGVAVVPAGRLALRALAVLVVMAAVMAAAAADMVPAPAPLLAVLARSVLSGAPVVPIRPRIQETFDALH